MAPRVKTADQPISKLERYRALLALDRDDLDSAVADQPELFNKVADAHTLAVAERDALDLDLERMQAKVAGVYRQQAADNQEKMTEGALKEKVILHVDVKRLAS